MELRRDGSASAIDERLRALPSLATDMDSRLAPLIGDQSFFPVRSPPPPAARASALNLASFSSTVLARSSRCSCSYLQAG